LGADDFKQLQESMTPKSKHNPGTTQLDKLFKNG